MEEVEVVGEEEVEEDVEVEVDEVDRGGGRRRG